MRSLVPAASVLLALAGAASAQAQHTAPNLGVPVQPASGNPATDVLLVPIHTQPDDPAGGAYGTWAAGPNFKASFHRGYEFYPLLGPDYPENLPLAWRTESVTAGGKPVFEAGTVPAHRGAALRYEYHFPGVVEAYDVRVEGVEQTFTLAVRPAQAGDLVVKGRVTTKLRAARLLEDEHAPITFRAENGKDIVTYGQAFAIDALGQKTNVTTTFDGTTLSLKVPGAWLADAVYPVVIDPLTAAVSISTWGGGTFGLASYPAVGRDDESTSSNIMTFYARQFSASDFDGYARLTNNDFSNSVLVYTDVTTSWSTLRAGVASVGGADRWTLCLERQFGGTTGNRVRIYLHDFANTTQNSGSTLFPEPGAGRTDSYPEVGGTRSFSAGTNALLVFQSDVSTGANTNHTEAYGMLINASGTGSFGTRFLLSTGAVGTRYDRELPAVNQESNGGTSSWIVTWQELDRSIVNDDLDTYIARITSTGTNAGLGFVGPASGASKTNPRIAGREGRYMTSYLRGGNSLEVQRFDWLDNAATPVKKQINVVAAGITDYANGAIAYDTVTDSHWALVYQRGPYTTSDLFVARVGYTGGPTETATVYSQASTGGYSPSITFDDDSQAFLLVYATTENPPSGLPVYGRTFNYSSNAVNVAYGTGCGPATPAADQPLAGDEFWTIRLTGAPANQPALLFLGSLTANLPLAGAGMGSCTLNIGNFLVSLVTATNAGGSAAIEISLPDDPAFIGNAYFQWFYGYPAAAWPTKFAGAQGLRVQVR